MPLDPRLSRAVMLLAACFSACGDDRTATEQLPIGGQGGTGGIAGVAGGQAGVGAIAGFGSSQAGTGGIGGMGFAGAAGASGQTAAGAGGIAGTAAGSAGTAGGGAAGAAGGLDDAAVADSSGGMGDYEPCPPAGEACTILPLGDSITFGIGYGGGYRVELFRKALADGKSITFSGSQSNGPSTVEGEPFPRSNEGHSGWKIDQLRSLIPAPALEEEPHIILLMIGTNDIAQRDDLADAPERLGSLIDLLATNAPDALIVVATIVPLSFGGGIETYNDALPAVVDARVADGKHVLLVDQFTGFPISELGDGVHPNQQGYERMAGVWYAAIASMLH